MRSPYGFTRPDATAHEKDHRLLVLETGTSPSSAAVNIAEVAHHWLGQEPTP